MYILPILYFYHIVWVFEGFFPPSQSSWFLDHFFQFRDFSCHQHMASMFNKVLSAIARKDNIPWLYIVAEENSFQSTVTCPPQIMQPQIHALDLFHSQMLGQSRKNPLCFWAEPLSHLSSEQDGCHCLGSTPRVCLSAPLSRDSGSFPEVVGKVRLLQEHFSFRKLKAESLLKLQESLSWLRG